MSSEALDAHHHFRMLKEEEESQSLPSLPHIRHLTPGKATNVFGVLNNVKNSSRKYAHSDVYMSLSLVDMSCCAQSSDEALVINVFATDRTQLPLTLTLGDVICCPQLELRVFRRKLQGTVSAQMKAKPFVISLDRSLRHQQLKTRHHQDHVKHLIEWSQSFRQNAFIEWYPPNQRPKTLQDLMVVPAGSCAIKCCDVIVHIEAYARRQTTNEEKKVITYLLTGKTMNDLAIELHPESIENFSAQGIFDILDTNTALWIRFRNLKIHLTARGGTTLPLPPQLAAEFTSQSSFLCLPPEYRPPEYHRLLENQNHPRNIQHNVQISWTIPHALAQQPITRLIDVLSNQIQIPCQYHCLVSVSAFFPTELRRATVIAQSEYQYQMCLRLMDHTAGLDVLVCGKQARRMFPDLPPCDLHRNVHSFNAFETRMNTLVRRTTNEENNNHQPPLPLQLHCGIQSYRIVPASGSKAPRDTIRFQIFDTVMTMKA